MLVNIDYIKLPIQSVLTNTLSTMPDNLSEKVSNVVSNLVLVSVTKSGTV